VYVFCARNGTGCFKAHLIKLPTAAEAGAITACVATLLSSSTRRVCITRRVLFSVVWAGVDDLVALFDVDELQPANLSVRG
jgi:hypothetical protein